MDRRNGFSPAQLEELAELIDSRKLSDDQIDEIAAKAAAKAVDQMTNEAYRLVGKTFVEKFLWFIGVLVVGTASYLAGKGWFKP
jgi:hypothetical protein